MHFLCLLPNWKLCNNLDKKSQFIPVSRVDICAVPPWDKVEVPHDS